MAEERPPISSATKVVGRYAIGPVIASGGMALVHLGQLVGPAGFSRLVAIKHMHPHLSRDAEFVQMFLDEARLAARVRHNNVVSVLDVLDVEGELYLVMDYVHGESLSRLVKASADRGESIDIDIAVALVTGVLHGLQAAHEATDENGEPLALVHRDVSPQNVLVGVDGVARVVDFGVAKASGRLQSTRDGQVKGKLAYMAPEQILEEAVDKRTDVYAASVLLWEILTGRRLFQSADAGATVAAILAGGAPPPSWHRTGVPKALDEIVQRGLSSARDERFASAHEMAMALEKAVPAASASTVSAWVEGLCQEALKSRSSAMAELERARPVDKAPREEVTSPSTGSATQLSAERGIEEPTSQRRAVVASIAAAVVLVPIALSLALLPSRTRSTSTPRSASAEESASARVASAPPGSESAAASASAPPGKSPCDGAPCKPEALATKLLGAAALSVDAGRVYFATTAGIAKVATAGGRVESLTPASRGAFAIAVAGSHVYFGGVRDVFRVEAAGGTPVLVASTQSTVLCLTAHGSRAFFSADSAVHTVSASEAKSQVIAAGQPDAYGVAVFGEHVYFTRYAKNGDVRRVSVAGGSVETLATGLNHPAGIAADSEGVYVAVQNAGSLLKIPHSGGAPSVLASGFDLPTGVTVSEGWVYVTAQNSGVVSKLPAGGGKAVPIAVGQSFPTGIASDSSGVYWVNSGPSSALMRLPK